MARELKRIDISSIPELLRIAREVGKSGEARVLRSNDKDLALVVPVLRTPRRGGRRRKTAADIEAFRAAAGSWKDVDTDKLLADIHEGRRSSRPPVDL